MFKSIEFVGSVYSRSGYGWAARNYVKAFLAGGFDVCLTALRWGQTDDEVAADFPEYAGLVKAAPAGSLRVCHSNPAFSRAQVERFAGPAPEGSKTILLTVWETDRLPGVAVEACNSFDAVIVPTTWNFHAFRDSGVKVPIHVLPHPYDPDDYPDLSDWHGDQDERYTFYWLGAWVERKNPIGILRAYFHAFGPSDPVRLVLKTGGVAEEAVLADIDAVRRNMNLADRGFPPVVAAVEQWSDKQIRDLHLHSNCYVSLARGEGWNVPMFEAAILGNAIIFSGCGGHEWAMAALRGAEHVRCFESPAFGDPGSSLFNGSMLWADPDLEHAAIAMKRKIKLTAAGGWQHKHAHINRNGLSDLTTQSVGKRAVEILSKL